jgi:hypothetical protein
LGSNIPLTIGNGYFGYVKSIINLFPL